MNSHLPHTIIIYIYISFITTCFTWSVCVFLCVCMCRPQAKCFTVQSNNDRAPYAYYYIA